MPTKTLITGISGFIAGHLAREITWSGDSVIGTGRTPPRDEIAPFCQFASLDIREYDTVLALFQSEKPDTLYHLAAYSTLHTVVTEGPRAFLQTNVAGTANVLEAARLAGVGTVVVASSDKQYGALAIPPYDDEDRTAFINGGVYELSKTQQDQTARLYAGLYDSPAVRVARLVNVYGPGDLQWTRIVPGNIRRAFQGERPKITSGPAGEALREYLFVDDAITALRALADDARQRGNAPLRRVDGKLARVAFNLSSGHKHAAADVIATIQSVLREDFGRESLPPEVLPGTPGVFEPGSQFTDGAKIRALLPDFAPRDLVSGLRETLPWYLQHLRAEQAAG